MLAQELEAVTGERMERRLLMNVAQVIRSQQTC